MHQRELLQGFFRFFLPMQLEQCALECVNRSLRLSVGLWMVWGRERMLYVLLTKVVKQHGGELGPIV